MMPKLPTRQPGESDAAWHRRVDVVWHQMHAEQERRITRRALVRLGALIVTSLILWAIAVGIIRVVLGLLNLIFTGTWR